MQKKMKNNWLIVLLTPFIFISCNWNDVFISYKPIADKGWSKDSLYSFDVSITDTKTLYNIYVNIRNNGDYPYQNMWIFLKNQQPDSVIVSDSIECYLADQRGKWLGKGTGSVYEMPILYQQNIKFEKPGIYHYTLVHGMRDSVLKGVSDIGLRVEKVN